jgi:photosystem II stability/assembly factor-like uncharacterized protein
MKVTLYMKIQFVVAFALISISINSAKAQQWERMPIYGGGLDQLEVSRFDSSFVVGYMTRGLMYLSNNAGVTWEEIPAETDTMWHTIHDVDITRNKTLLALTRTGLWISTDFGAHWVWDEALNANDIADGSIKQADDGTIVISIVGKSGTKVVKSVNEGKDWIDLLLVNARVDVFVCATNSNVIVVLSRGAAYSSKDGGTTWRTSALPLWPCSSIIEHDDDEGLRLGVLMTDRAMDDNFTYFESRDSGFTWEQISTHPLTYSSKYHCDYTLNNRIILSHGKLLTNVCQHLFISWDMGKTWSQEENIVVYDIVKVNDTVLASFMCPSIMVWDENAGQWLIRCDAPRWYNYEFAQHVHADGDTSFVLLSTGREGNDRWSELQQSTDGGSTWTRLLFKKGLNWLDLDASGDTRYYMSAIPEGGARAILTGRVDQSHPDTLYTSASHAALTASDVFLHHLYLVEYRSPDWFLGYTANGGESWEWSIFPGVYDHLKVIPSQVDPQRYGAVVYARQEWVTTDGLYYTSDSGLHWERTNDNVIRGYGIDAINKDDIYFQGWDARCSNDYGKTWYEYSAGLDSSRPNYNTWNPGGRVIRWDFTYLYEYYDDCWRRLYDDAGVPLLAGMLQGRDLGNDIDIDASRVYITIPYKGVFRANYSRNSTVVHQRQSKSENIRIDIYPHPVDGDEIIIRSSARDYQDMHVMIYNIQGSLVKELIGDFGTNIIIWDKKDKSGRSVTAGVYLLHAKIGSKTINRKIIIQY